MPDFQDHSIHAIAAKSGTVTPAAEQETSGISRKYGSAMEPENKTAAFAHSKNMIAPTLRRRVEASH